MTIGPRGAPAVALIGFLCASAAAGQSRGRVHDQDLGTPIAGALVEASGGPAGGQRTDSHGSFEVQSHWRPGGMIVVSAIGYRQRTLSWRDAEANQWRIGLERDPLALDEIVVTAGGRARRRSEVAIPIATVKATEIQATGAPSVDRLLAELPGLQVTAGVPTGSNLLIRGIGGARVLVLLDGRPAPGSLIESRDLSRMSLAGVERVEVVKGPLSSLYGSDALGGVVNVITRAPATGFRIDGRALHGGAGRRQSEVEATGGGRLRYRLTGAWRQEDQMPGLVSASGDGFARVWDLRSDLRFDATEAWDLRGGLNLLRERQRWPVGGGFSGFNDNTGVSGWLEATRAAGPGEWKTTVFLQDYEHLYRSARGDAPIASDDDTPQWERETRAVSTYSATLGDHHVDAGVEGASRGIRSPDKLIEERVSDTQMALFAQDAWHLGEAVLTAGGRLGWNSRWGSNLSPTIGLVRSASEQLRLRGTVARGFRAPSFKELTWQFANLGAGYVLQGFPDLVPERSWNVSGGVEWSPRASVRIDAEAYWNQVDDLIEPGFVGNTPSGLLIYSPRNVSDVTTRGFEVGVLAVSGVGAFMAGYAYLDARSPESDTPLDRRPKHSARLRGSWVVTAPARMRLDATVHVTGEAPILGNGPDGRITRTDTQGRFTALDVQASIDVWRHLELSAGVDNVFNARPSGWQALIDRRFRVGLAVRELFGR
ncbi:MAG: TonB-dependent receptor [Gemmatimonadota bacterium]|nr:TonB-dependent receptor [Gemmatimonadota bacterium]MDE2865285.1 TonB-dependent receptor [Gemmatimonadota bacterium]